MKYKKIRKLFISFAFTLSLSLACLFGFFSWKKASAAPDPSNPLIGDIFDYSWANWFDESKTDYYLYTTNAEVYGFHSLSNGFEFIVDSDYTGATLIFDFCNNDYVSWSNSPLHSLVDYNVVNREFTWSFTMDYGSDSFYYDDAILIAQNGITQSKEFECMALDVDYIESDYTDTVSVYMRIYNLPIPDSPTAVRIQNITLNRGSVPYTYSPFWDSLTDFPSPLPYPIGSTPPEDSSSDSSSEIPEPPEDSSSDSSSEIPEPPEDSSSDSSSEIPEPPEDNEGYDEGYNAGYTAGLNYGKYGLFANCSCYIQLNYLDYYERIPATEQFFIYGGLDLSKFKPLVENKTGVIDWFIYFSFDSDALPISPDFQFSGTGYYDVFYDNPWSITFKNVPNSNQLRWNLVSEDSASDYNNVYRSEIPSSGYQNRYLILSFKTPYFNSFSYLNGLTISVYNPLYELGFQQGLNAADNEAYGKGYEAGYNQGDIDGFNRGFNKGSSEDPYGLADFMFAYLDMPGRILSNWLNFEFMDVNLMGLLTLVISVGLVAIVLKKVL